MKPDHPSIHLSLYLSISLAQATGRPLLESAELQLLCYPPGGHYMRHVDVGSSTAHLPVKRSISILIFLTQHDWSPAKPNPDH